MSLVTPPKSNGWNIPLIPPALRNCCRMQSVKYRTGTWYMPISCVCCCGKKSCHGLLSIATLPGYALVVGIRYLRYWCDHTTSAVDELDKKY
jgi:hypothetical protein